MKSHEFSRYKSELNKFRDQAIRLLEVMPNGAIPGYPEYFKSFEEVVMDIFTWAETTTDLTEEQIRDLEDPV